MTFQTNEKRMSNLRKIRESDEDVALYRWILTERRGELILWANQANDKNNHGITAVEMLWALLVE